MKTWESIKNKESPHDQLSEKRVQNTSNSTFHLLKIETERKHKGLYGAGQGRSYIGYVFILSPDANAFQHQQLSHS